MKALHDHLLIRRPEARVIGLIADTHVPDRRPDLHPGIAPAFHHADLILHAGDISGPAALERLGRLAETLAVQGNNRGDRTRFHPPLPMTQVVEAAHGWRIGMFHGLENTRQRISDVLLGRSGFKALCTQRLVRRVSGRFHTVPLVLYGHGHWPLVQVQEGCLYINPGQAFSRTGSSCALLTLAPRSVTVQVRVLGSAGRRFPAALLNPLTVPRESLRTE